MKVTVLTPSKNSGRTIEDTLRSVREQTYVNIEHIVVDGHSTDGVAEILDKYRSPNLRVIRGRDKNMYDAINKGLAAATGDVVAVLNSDDVYADREVIGDVVQKFVESGADSVYGDIVYVRQDDLNRVVRYWRSGEWNRRDIERGWTPPHTAFFIKKRVYDTYGGYDIDYRIAADYEITLRFLYTRRITAAYLHRLCTRMRLGGMSNRSLSCMLQKSKEDHRACKAHSLRHPALTVMMKNLRKATQFIERVQ